MHKSQTLPSSLMLSPSPSVVCDFDVFRAASFDGDADRIVLMDFFENEPGKSLDTRTVVAMSVLVVDSVFRLLRFATHCHRWRPYGCLVGPFCLFHTAEEWHSFFAIVLPSVLIAMYLCSVICLSVLFILPTQMALLSSISRMF